MSLPLPKLDDRNFEDLLEEAISLIPRYNREWTDFNPSDPGIALVELFAWLSEMMLYRIDQVTEKNQLKFLELIGIEPDEGEDIKTAFARAVKYLDDRYRLVAEGDYESLALAAIDDYFEEKGTGPVQARAACVNNRNLDPGVPEINKDGHISLIVIPGVNDYCPSDELIDYVRSSLEEMRLLTQRLHIVAPEFRQVRIEGWLVLVEGADSESVKDEAGKKLKEFINPISGGPDGSGWPLGRPLYISEIYQILEGISFVDHIDEVIINRDKSIDKVVLLEYQLFEFFPEPLIVEVSQ